MSTTLPVGRPLEELLAEMPAIPADPQTRTRLVAFCHALDHVGRIDELTQQAYVDEDQFRRLGNEFSSSAFTEQLIAYVKQDPRQLVRSHIGQVTEATRHITWLELANQLGENVPREETFQGIGLSAASTPADVERAIKQHYPTAPAVLFDSEALHKLVTRAIDATGSTSAPNEISGEAVHPEFNGSGFLSCLGRSIPLWIAMAVWGAIVGLVIAGAIGALIGFAAGFGFGLLLSVLVCLAQNS